MVTHTMTYSFKWTLLDEPTVGQMIRQLLLKVVISEELVDTVLQVLEESDLVSVLILLAQLALF